MVIASPCCWGLFQNTTIHYSIISILFWIETVLGFLRVDEQGGRGVSSLVFCLCDLTSRVCPQRWHVWQESGAQHKRFGMLWLSLWLSLCPHGHTVLLSHHPLSTSPQNTNPSVTPRALLGFGTAWGAPSGAPGTEGGQWHRHSPARCATEDNQTAGAKAAG